MKIKNDFVTNSSSTSYLVYIPDGFEIRKFKDMILSKFEDDVVEYCTEFSEEPITKDEFFEKFFKEFDYLVKSGGLYQYDNYPAFYLSSNFLGELELVIGEEQTGSEAGLIQNINTDIMKNKISTIKSGGWGMKYGGWGYESKD